MAKFTCLLTIVVFVSAQRASFSHAASLDASASCVPANERQACGDYSCNRTTHRCSQCKKDDDCTERALYCDTTTGKCENKALKDGGDGLTVLAPLISIFVCATGVVAGLGGGGILVPAFWLILGVPVTSAVGLSQVTIVGQSVFNMVLQVQRRHPDHDGSNGTASWPLINYEMLLLILPFALVGTLLGKMAGSVSPDWLRVGMLAILLGALMVRLIQRLMLQRKKDAEAKALRKERQIAPSEPASASNGTSGSVEMPSVSEASNDTASPQSMENGESGAAEMEMESPAAATTPTEEEEVDLAAMDLHSTHPANGKSQYPVVFILIAVTVFCVQLMFSVIRSDTVGVISCGSGAYVGVIVAAVVWNACASFATRLYLVHLRKRNKEGHRPPSVTPFHWSPVTTMVFPVLSLVAGGAASWFGIGGGMILNSLLLESKIVPAAVSATGGMSTMMTALQSAAIFLVDGELQWDYSLVMLASGFIGTALGQLVVMERIRRAGAQYLIIVALLIILVGSMVTQLAMGIYRTVDIIHQGGSVGFVALCN